MQILWFVCAAVASEARKKSAVQEVMMDGDLGSLQSLSYDAMMSDEQCTIDTS